MEPRDPIHGLTADEFVACDRMFDLLARELSDAAEVIAIERDATADPIPFRQGRRPERPAAEAPADLPAR